jgi:hypothetical protein
MAQLNFDASQVAPSTGVSDPVPAAWYNAAITDSTIKPTNDGTGTILAFVFTIVDGAFANRKIFVNLNIKNANPTAQEIAYKDLSAIAHAVGVLQVPNSEVLHNIPMKIKVKIRPAKGDYEASNAISSYKNINEPVSMAAAGAPAAGFGAVQPPAQQHVQMPPQQQFQQPQQQFQQPAQQMQQQQFQQPVQQPAQAWQQPAAAQPWQQQQAPVQQQQAPQQQFQPQQQMQVPPQQQQMQHPAQQYVDPTAQAQMQQQFQQPAQQPQQQYQQAPQQQQMQQPAGNPATGVTPPWVQG